MKRLVIIFAVVALLALDWAALHDILKRNEPGYAAEYSMLTASIVIFAALLFTHLRKRSRPA
jgi:ABC-type sulfate transport system permease component